MTIPLIESDIDDVLKSCMQLDKPKSFFLFAGAGSGKTSSLIRVLEYFKENHSSKMTINGRQIAIITYTNVACEVIRSRLNFSPIFYVSTIHSFVWDLIQGFNNDIKVWLTQQVQTEIEQLVSENQKLNPTTKKFSANQRKIEANNKRLKNLPNITKFIYSPTGQNSTRDSLNHSEIIKIGAEFISNKLVMQQLLVQKFPFLLIDESQDTHKLLIDAFFKVQSVHKEYFGLGLFGDTMQRIFSDGKIDIDRNLPLDWAKPAKGLNYRCPTRIVQLINKIRVSADAQQQTAVNTDNIGVLRFFISCAKDVDRFETEKLVRKKMGLIANDPGWQEGNGVKTLILEHHMAAKRMDFYDLFEPLHKIEEFKDGLRSGGLPVLRFFTENILPLVRAKEDENQFKIASIVRKQSPLFGKENAQNPIEINAERVKTASDAVSKLFELVTPESNPTFLDVLKLIARYQLFEIPEALTLFSDSGFDETKDLDLKADTKDAAELAIFTFLKTPFKKIKNYDAYVRGSSPFGTHQGVKGDEFDRVMVVLDDEEAGGFLFDYEKVFNAKPKTTTDLNNEVEGKETSSERTKRLLYVICSRSKKNLAIVMYSSAPEKAKKYALTEGWFEESEIEILNHEVT
jgi:DNA helicase-2/ATP-dependent DNA helicase PcrA